MSGAGRNWAISVLLISAVSGAAQQFKVTAPDFGTIVQPVSDPTQLQQSFTVDSSPASGIAFTVTSSESWLSFSPSGDCSIDTAPSVSGTTSQTLTACAAP